jgi:hypothetical protein
VTQSVSPRNHVPAAFRSHPTRRRLIPDPASAPPLASLGNKDPPGLRIPSPDRPCLLPGPLVYKRFTYVLFILVLSADKKLRSLSLSLRCPYNDHSLYPRIQGLWSLSFTTVSRKLYFICRSNPKIPTDEPKIVNDWSFLFVLFPAFLACTSSPTSWPTKSSPLSLLLPFGSQRSPGVDCSTLRLHCRHVAATCLDWFLGTRSGQSRSFTLLRALVRISWSRGLGTASPDLYHQLLILAYL